MSMKCSICTDPKRLQIDKEIVRGGNLSKVAEIYSLQYSSLYRHSKNCISRQLSQAMEKKETEQAFSILENIQTILSRVENIFIRNYDKNSLGTDVVALKAISEQRSTLELLSKISYALSQAKTVELEILRLQSNEGTEEDQEEYAENLKALSTPELKLFLSLLSKIENRTKEDVLGVYLESLTTSLPIFFDAESDNENTQVVVSPSKGGNRLKRTRFPDKKTGFEGMQVREIPGQIIPG